MSPGNISSLQIIHMSSSVLSSLNFGWYTDFIWFIVRDFFLLDLKTEPINNPLKIFGNDKVKTSISIKKPVVPASNTVDNSTIEVMKVSREIPDQI